MPLADIFGPLLAFAVDRPSGDAAQLILNQAGFTFTLTDGEAYSHATRKRAYAAKAQESFAILSEQRQNGAVKALATYFWNHELASRQRLISILQAAGWSFDGSKFFSETEGSTSAFFEKGQTHDAYIYIREVLQKAHKEVFIVDPYSGSVTLQMLATIPPPLSVRILKGSKSPSDFTTEAERFSKQHTSISLEIRNSDVFHDRFVILDSKTVYFFGASIKDAANKAFAIFAVESRPLGEMIMRYAEEVWKTASIVFPPS